MTAEKNILGRCPRCGETIGSGWTVIEYERANGTTGIFAECPGCEEIVEPR